MTNDLAQESILCALSGNWQKAVELNLQILKLEPQNTEALNRLARAYSEIGKTSLAKKTSQEVLKIDPFNPIAIKSMEKWRVLKKGKTFVTRSLNSETFLEEPGKTKVVTLLHLGDPSILVKLDSADEVKLDHHSHRVSVVSQDGKYVGRLPDDLSARMKQLITHGNVYQTFIMSVDKSEVKVFIREVERSAKFADTQSFPTEKIDYISFTPPELVHDKSEIELSIPNSEE
jgi:tetratricopeptide (TPR) repeat protein